MHSRTIRIRTMFGATVAALSLLATVTAATPAGASTQPGTATQAPETAVVTIVPAPITQTWTDQSDQMSLIGEGTYGDEHQIVDTTQTRSWDAQGYETIVTEQSARLNYVRFEHWRLVEHREEHDLLYQATVVDPAGTIAWSFSRERYSMHDWRLERCHESRQHESATTYKWLWTDNDGTGYNVGKQVTHGSTRQYRHGKLVLAEHHFGAQYWLALTGAYGAPMSSNTWGWSSVSVWRAELPAHHCDWRPWHRHAARHHLWG